MTAAAMADFQIRASGPNSPVTSLSGGNQQKVMLARVFSLGLDALILNEPTRGIDVGAKSEVYRYIQDAAERGVAVVMVSSELPELLGITDRIVALYQGEINGEFDTESCDEEQLAHAVLAPAGAAAERPDHKEDDV